MSNQHQQMISDTTSYNDIILFAIMMSAGGAIYDDIMVDRTGRQVRVVVRERSIWTNN